MFTVHFLSIALTSAPPQIIGHEIAEAGEPCDMVILRSLCRPREATLHRSRAGGGMWPPLAPFTHELPRNGEADGETGGGVDRGTQERLDLSFASGSSSKIQKLNQAL